MDDQFLQSEKVIQIGSIRLHRQIRSSLLLSFLLVEFVRECQDGSICCDFYLNLNFLNKNQIAPLFEYNCELFGVISFKKITFLDVVQNIIVNSPQSNTNNFY